jgi:hypothetical protein
MREETTRRGAAVLAVAGALALGAVAMPEGAAAMPQPASTAAVPGNGSLNPRGNLDWWAMHLECTDGLWSTGVPWGAHYYDGGHVCAGSDNVPGVRGVNYLRACQIQYQRGDVYAAQYTLDSPTNVICFWTWKPTG